MSDQKKKKLRVIGAVDKNYTCILLIELTTHEIDSQSTLHFYIPYHG